MVTPMFPLGMTVLPGMAVPLQVFEPRYVRLVRDLLARDDDPGFGTVMIERGWEVGGGDVRSPVGTMVRMAGLRAVPGDRYVFVAVGTHRIRVEEWLADEPYPRARVVDWPDEGTPPADLAERIARLETRLGEIEAIARDLDLQVAPPRERDDQAVNDPELALYELAARGPIGPADRSRVLTAPSIGERCEVLSAALDDAMAVLEFRRT